MTLKANIDMIAKIIGIIIVLVSAIFAFAYRDYQITEYDKRLTNVEALISTFPKIDRNEKDIIILDKKVMALDRAYIQVCSDIAVLKNNNATVEKKLDAIAYSLNRLDDKIDKLKEQK
jgi:septal ring factor EnvC (AmiA/AmiB activator)